MQAEDHRLTRVWILRGLGFIYLVIFSIVFFQGRALWGMNGLLPIDTFMVDWRTAQGEGLAPLQLAWRLPTLFHFVPAAEWLKPLAVSGLAVALALLFGYANFFLLFWLWLLQLSLVNSGQLFYGFGWEIAVLELTFLCFFLVPFWDPRLKQYAVPPSRFVLWAMRWMLFRLMFGAGMIKIRGDSCWRDLTCLIYHYESQPNPHPLSIFFHWMPPWFHKLGTAFNHFVELIVPFGFFGPQRLRQAAGVLTLVFQLTIMVSGNLAWLNWLTVVLTIACFDDGFLERFTPRWWRPSVASVNFTRSALFIQIAFGLAVLALSMAPARNLLRTDQAMNTSYDNWHLLNSYGAFGSIGRERLVVLIEGSDDGEAWQSFEFPCWTGDVKQRPCLVTPYHHHIDWQLWFSAMRPRLEEEWLLRLAVRLLENDPDIRGRLRHSPFGDRAPKLIRMDLYRYRFAEPSEWPSRWWERDRLGPYMPPVSLEHPLAQKYARRTGE